MFQIVGGVFSALEPLAFWGAYGMIVFAIISYALPNMTGRKLYDSARGRMAYWLSNISMTVAFGVAGCGTSVFRA